MPEYHGLITDNIGYLRQALELLLALSDELYSSAVPLAFNSSVGAHVRHCLEHYECFVAGWRAREIDYDARPRDRRVEQERAVAQGRIEKLIAELRQIAAEEKTCAVRVKQDSNTAPNAIAAWSASSVRRELQFLVSHTVHHFALIAMMLRMQGFEPSADFGVAPSTLKYRQVVGD